MTNQANPNGEYHFDVSKIRHQELEPSRSKKNENWELTNPRR
jgi:hypothetical protein